MSGTLSKSGRSGIAGNKTRSRLYLAKYFTPAAVVLYSPVVSEYSINAFYRLLQDIGLIENAILRHYSLL